MLQIFDIVSSDRLRKLLSQYSEAFHVTIYLLDSNKELLLAYPDDSLQKEILTKPLNLRDSLIGHVAVPLTDKEAETHLSFIEQNLSEMIEMGYEIDSLQSMLFSTAEAFAFAIEAKDPYTYGHSKRVSEMVVQIGSHLGLPSDTLNWIKLAALLHDIGKIGTPEDILHKSEELTPAEMNKVKEHSVIGAKLVEHIKRMKEIAQWIYHHHEKYDGSGYPTGIEGNEIPLAARIISIADTFDALTSDRPYRKAFTKEEAIRIMRKYVGLHFDPFLFRCFEEEVQQAKIRFITSDISMDSVKI